MNPQEQNINWAETLMPEYSNSKQERNSSSEFSLMSKKLIFPLWADVHLHCTCQNVRNIQITAMNISWN